MIICICIQKKYILLRAIKKGYIKVKDGKIQGIYDDIDDNDFVDYKNYIIVPGFIDVHIHGWATGSFVHEGTEKKL